MNYQAFPPSRMPASVEMSIKLAVCLSVCLNYQGEPVTIIAFCSSECDDLAAPSCLRVRADPPPLAVRPRRGLPGPRPGRLARQRGGRPPAHPRQTRRTRLARLSARDPPDTRRRSRHSSTVCFLFAPRSYATLRPGRSRPPMLGFLRGPRPHPGPTLTARPYGPRPGPLLFHLVTYPESRSDSDAPQAALSLTPWSRPLTRLGRPISVLF